MNFRPTMIDGLRVLSKAGGRMLWEDFIQQVTAHATRRSLELHGGIIKLHPWSKRKAYHKPVAEVVITAVGRAVLMGSKL